MSSGAKFLRKKTSKDVAISKGNLTDVIGQWLHATRLIDDAKNITNIEFHPHTDKDRINLRVYTTGGTKEESDT